MNLQPPLVGRASELNFLESLAREVTNGEGKLVLLSGEAGIGKTRLANEFSKLAGSKGLRVVVGRCIPGAPTPYLPFHDAFENYFKISQGRNEDANIEKAAAEVGLLGWIRGPKKRVASHSDPESERERTLHATLELLLRISKQHPLLMVLDDLQWADSASIQLLHFLARNRAELRVLILATYRPEELYPDTLGKPHPLIENLRIMRREAICNELSLRKLSEEEVKIAIEGALGGEVDPSLAEKIASQSGGNPLFVTEIVSLLVQGGSIARTDGVWRAVKQVRLEIPPQ